MAAAPPATRPSPVDTATAAVAAAQRHAQQTRAMADAAKARCLADLHATADGKRLDADVSAKQGALGDAQKKGMVGLNLLDMNVAVAAAQRKVTAAEQQSLADDAVYQQALANVRSAESQVMAARQALATTAAAWRAETAADRSPSTAPVVHGVALSVAALDVRGPALVGQRVSLDPVTFNAAGLASVSDLPGVAADDGQPGDDRAPLGLRHRSDWVGLTAIGRTGAFSTDVFLPAGPLRNHVATWLDGRSYTVTGRVVRLVRDGRFGIVVESIDPAP